MMKKITGILFTLILVLSLCSSSVLAETGTYEERQLSRITDAADILTDSEEDALLSKLDEISERQQCDVAVVTMTDLPADYSSVESLADDIYDYYGFGMGDGDDGMLLILVMGSHDWHITTYGYGATVITDAGRKYMSEMFLPYLSDGNYAEGFTKYAELCDEFITQAKTGEPYDVNNIPKNIDWLKWVGYSLIIGIALAFGLANILKSKMKSVALQTAAGSYLREGSLEVEQSRDTFLYSVISKTEKPKEKDSNGGSSMHISSSGRSHGGGGGKF